MSNELEEINDILINERKNKEDLTQQLYNITMLLDKMNKKKYICNVIITFLICITILAMFFIYECFANADKINADEINNYYQNKGNVTYVQSLYHKGGENRWEQ